MMTKKDKLVAKAVGKRLKEARKLREMTQKQVAEFLGMVQSSYIKYELGLVEFDYKKIILLAKLFEVTTDYFFGLADY